MSTKELSRREFLKVAIAASGAVAAAGFLPGKWLKPVIQTGVLPAHAQVSPVYRVSATATLTGGPVAGGITSITATVTAGAGAPVGDVNVTMDSTNTPPVSLSAPSIVGTIIPLPQTVLTGINGIAYFADLTIGGCPADFWLTFSFSLPGSPTCNLGPYTVPC